MPTGVGAVAATNEDAAALVGIAAAFFLQGGCDAKALGEAAHWEGCARNWEKSILL